MGVAAALVLLSGGVVGCRALVSDGSQTVEMANSFDGDVDTAFVISPEQFQPTIDLAILDSEQADWTVVQETDDTEVVRLEATAATTLVSFGLPGEQYVLASGIDYSYQAHLVELDGVLLIIWVDSPTDQIESLLESLSVSTLVLD